MRTAFLASLLVACGGSARTTQSPNNSRTSAATGPAIQLWAAVMKPGAVFSFVEPASDDPVSVEATVTDVQDVEGGRAAMITWTENGAPMSAAGLPAVVVVTSDAVILPPASRPAKSATARVRARAPVTAPTSASPRSASIPTSASAAARAPGGPATARSRSATPPSE